MTVFGEYKSASGGNQSIITHYLKWKGAGDKGVFAYYDKEASSDKEYKPEEFIVVREAYCIDGYSKKNNSGIYSNHIEDFSDTLTVKSKEDLIAEGEYRDIKESVESAGGKLHIVLSCLADNGDVIQMKLKGAAYSSWLSAMETVNTNTHKVKFDGFEDKENGAVKYRSPKFGEGKKITKEEVGRATKLAKTFRPEEETVEINPEDIPF